MVTLDRIKTISKYFFKKNLKDIIYLAIILFIATILFSSAVIINRNVSSDYDRLHEELNTADMFFTILGTEYSDKLLEDIENIDNIKEVDVQKGIMLSVPVKMDGSMQEQVQIFYNMDISPRINKREIILGEVKSGARGIYLANYTFIHSGLKLGEDFEFKINNTPYSFTVLGVVNEMQYGNYASSVIGEYLDSDSYSNLLENNIDKEVVTISIKGESSKDTYNEVSKYLTGKGINILNKNEKENAKSGRLITTNIIVLILMVFSSIMLIISLFVSKFKIGETIEEELANMGVLKALGYTSREIITSCILPYIICGVVCSFFGIILSYFLLPVLSKIIEMQSGFIWIPKIDLISNIFVFIINLVLITLFTFAATLPIKRLNPINAIRGLKDASNSKNHFEIEKTRGNIQYILMLKNFMNTKRQNILLGVVLFFITIALSFLGMLFYNVNMNPINFINTLVEEHPSVIVTSKNDIRSELSREDNVKNVLYYDENGSLSYKGNSYKTFVAENFDAIANDLCYEGRNPRSMMEVAIGSKLARDNNISIGDFITLTKNGIDKEYKVVGFIQSVNYFGEVIEITIDGYKELNSEYDPNSIYIYLENEDLVDDFIIHIRNKYDGDVITTMNYVESLNSAVDMFVPLISVVCIVIIVITLLLIYLILYILLNGIITRRKQELGVFKAIGYENKKLVRVLVGGFIPGVIISIVFGIIVSKLFIRNIYSMIFKVVGVYKVSFQYPIFVFVFIGCFLVISTMVIGSLLARRIKKISVYSLIKD